MISLLYYNYLIMLVYMRFPRLPSRQSNFTANGLMSSVTSNPNGLCPSKMSSDARLSELGRIVAAGVLRIREQSSPLSAASGDSSLAILPARSVSRPRARARNGGQ